MKWLSITLVLTTVAVGYWAWGDSLYDLDVFFYDTKADAAKWGKLAKESRYVFIVSDIKGYGPGKPLDAKTVPNNQLDTFFANLATDETYGVLQYKQRGGEFERQLHLAHGKVSNPQRFSNRPGAATLPVAFAICLFLTLICLFKQRAQLIEWFKRLDD